MTKINVNGVDKDMTSDEQTILDTEQASIQTQITAEANEATAKATAQASGNTKLLDLGLTQAEATALTGYTPSED